VRRSCLGAAPAAMVALLVVTSPALAQEPMLPGTYRFTERINGNPPIVLEGDITYTGDSLWVTAEWATCLWSSGTTRTVLRYECGRVLLSFDRIDPLRRADYSSPVMILERVEVCEEYTVNAAGQRVCARMKRDMVEREVTRQGRLRLRREGEAR